MDDQPTGIDISVFENLIPSLTCIVDAITQLVDAANAEGGYITDDGREIGWFEYQDYQKHKVMDEIAQLRAELNED